jgi:ABC-type sugar transport system permease subunit
MAIFRFFFGDFFLKGNIFDRIILLFSKNHFAKLWKIVTKKTLCLTPEKKTNKEKSGAWLLNIPALVTIMGPMYFIIILLFFLHFFHYWEIWQEFPKKNRKIPNLEKSKKKSQFSQQKEAQELVEKKNYTFFIPAIFRGGEKSASDTTLVPRPIRTLIILFSKMLKFFKYYFLQKSKIYILKDNSEYLGIFHLLKWNF